MTRSPGGAAPDPDDLDVSPALPFATDRKPAARPIWRESLAGLEWLALRSSPVYYGIGVPRGDGSAIVMVPGFLGHDSYLWEMAGWAARIGYRPYLSGIGHNAECLDILCNRLLETVERAFAETGRRVHLVGHSLGGLLSRSVATRRPDRVASVITMGSPFRGIRPHPLVLLTSERVGRAIRTRGGERKPACHSSHCECEANAALQRRLPATVAKTAIYTRTDGIVDWRFCINDDADHDVEVVGTHMGLAFNVAVYRTIAERIARTDELIAPERPRRRKRRYGIGWRTAA